MRCDFGADEGRYLRGQCTGQARHPFDSRATRTSFALLRVGGIGLRSTAGPQGLAMKPSFVNRKCLKSLLLRSKGPEELLTHVAATDNHSSPSSRQALVVRKHRSGSYPRGALYS